MPQPKVFTNGEQRRQACPLEKKASRAASLSVAGMAFRSAKTPKTTSSLVNPYGRDDIMRYCNSAMLPALSGTRALRAELSGDTWMKVSR